MAREWEGSASSISSGSHCTVSRSAADRLLLFLLPHLLFLPSVLSVKSRATCFAEAVVAAVSAAVVVIVGHGLRSEESASQSIEVPHHIHTV